MFGDVRRLRATDCLAATRIVILVDRPLKLYRQKQQIPKTVAETCDGNRKVEVADFRGFPLPRDSTLGWFVLKSSGWTILATTRSGGVLIQRLILGLS